jgi:ATP-dependent helicase/nuclease subunit B
MPMQPFLQKLAAYIFTHYPTKVSELCIVLPNKRAKIFLLHYLSKEFGKPIWAPAIYSIEDFISQLNGSQPIDEVTACFEFYSVYAKIEGEQAQSFDDFLTWAPTLLHDFNELDQYLIDTTALFNYLSDERAISLWNLGTKELSDFQKKYLRFWKSLVNYYTQYKQHLVSKNLQYGGMAYRKAAENCVQLTKNKNWFKLLFAGFNALNTAEKVCIKSLVDAGMADVLWDADEYYVNQTHQEAGKFIREFKALFPKATQTGEFLWQSNELATSAKRIVIAGVAQQVGQAMVAGELLQEMAKKDSFNFKNHALVLADENLLMPVLHALPDEIKQFNVTMGYPLQHLSLHVLMDSIFNLHENAQKFGKSGSGTTTRYYYHDIKKVLLHPYMIALSSNEDRHTKKSLRNFIHELENENILFVSHAKIEDYFSSENRLHFETVLKLLKPWQMDVTAAINSILTLLDSLLQHWINSGTQQYSMEREVASHYTKIIKRIHSLITNTSKGVLTEIKTLRSIVSQLVKSQSIAFIGEPLEGLQVMGMLETRTLDFETVILVSANEGILPAGKKENSFIPLELKSKFGLPTYADKDAIFGYHFYRLLQQAKEIYLIYNTETDEFGSGERSRFITQLQQELPAINKQVTIEEKRYTFELDKGSLNAAIQISKNEFVESKLLYLVERGLSPSLFNTYRDCSLKFYFKYIAGLEETEDPDDGIDNASFGTVIHAVLEKNYIPFVSQTIDAQKLKQAFKDLYLKVENEFRAIHVNGDLTLGINLLNVKVAEKYLEEFLATELKYLNELKKEGTVLKLLHLEKELTSTIVVNGITINLKGKADRIDQIGNTIRIIDYKTGYVEASQALKIKDWELLKNEKFNKGFQLLMYAYLWNKTASTNKFELHSGIYSLRSLSKGLMLVSVDGEFNLKEEILQQFEDELKVLLQEMFDLQKDFSQTSNQKICDDCAFKTICNR